MGPTGLATVGAGLLDSRAVCFADLCFAIPAGGITTAGAFATEKEIQ